MACSIYLNPLDTLVQQSTPCLEQGPVVETLRYESTSHLAAGVFAEGVEDAPDTLLHVVRHEAEGIDGVVNVLGGLKILPKARFPDHIEAFPLRTGPRLSLVLLPLTP